MTQDILDAPKRKNSLAVVLYAIALVLVLLVIFLFSPPTNETALLTEEKEQFKILDQLAQEGGPPSEDELRVQSEILNELSKKTPPPGEEELAGMAEMLDAMDKKTEKNN